MIQPDPRKMLFVSPATLSKDGVLHLGPERPLSVYFDRSGDSPVIRTAPAEWPVDWAFVGIKTRDAHGVEQLGFFSVERVLSGTGYKRISLRKLDAGQQETSE